MKKVFEDVEAITVGAEADRYSKRNDDLGTKQGSFEQFDFDEGAALYPETALKASYYACVVGGAWMLTFGSFV